MPPLQPGFSTTQRIKGEPQWVKGAPTAPGYYWVQMAHGVELARIWSVANSQVYLFGDGRPLGHPRVLAYMSAELNEPSPPPA